MTRCTSSGSPKASIAFPIAVECIGDRAPIRLYIRTGWRVSTLSMYTTSTPSGTPTCAVSPVTSTSQVRW
jgi:hypothetical protein